MNNEEPNANDDGTGTEREPGTGESSGRVDEERQDESGKADEKPNRDIDARESSDVKNRDQPNRSEITDPDQKVAAQVVAALMQLGVTESYSGMLPKPDDFNKYPPEVQERMCRWNDAFTIDESKRQDRLVDAEIKQASKGMWVSAFLIAGSIIVSMIIFLRTLSPYAFSVLSIPFISIITNIFEPIASRSSRNEKKDRQPSKGSDSEQPR